MTQTGKQSASRPPAGPAGAVPGSPEPADGGPGYLPPLLRRAWFGLNQAFRRRLAPTGLTPDQYTVLRLLSEAGQTGVMQRTLGERMASDPNTIASLLDRMERAGLVGRRPDTRDRRANRVRLMAEGRRRFEATRGIALELHGRVMQALPPEERAAFLAQLGRVAEAAQAALAESPRGGLGNAGGG